MPCLLWVWKNTVSEKGFQTSLFFLKVIISIEYIYIFGLFQKSLIYQRQVLVVLTLLHSGWDDLLLKHPVRRFKMQ